MHPPPPSPPPPPPPPPSPRTNIPMLYYGLVVVGTAAIILALYNFIVVKWCTELTDHRSRQRATRRQGPTSPRWRFHDLNSIHLIPSFKYKKDEDCGSECAVCLSVFEEGEELRRLPKCKHSFHAPCIDMWLYSHMDCPLCRSPVDEPVPQRPQIVVDESEHSREGLLAQATMV